MTIATKEPMLPGTPTPIPTPNAILSLSESPLDDAVTVLEVCEVEVDSE